ncbi:MAG: hypothetical protein WD894_23865 [Pirellulales bacterium]
MDEDSHDAPQTKRDGREVPPLIGAPLLTALMVFIVLPLLTWVVLFLMWLFG